MSYKSVETADPIVERLRKLAHERPDLAEAALIYEAILPLLRDADLHAVPLSLTAEEARAKLATGQPLLHELDLELDVEAARELMMRLARSLEALDEMRHGHMPVMTGLSEGGREDRVGLLPGAARRVRLAIDGAGIDVGALLSHAIADDHDSIESIARDIGLDPDLLRALARSALKPALAAWRRQLAPHAEGIQWEKGSCYLCGAVATLGELRENGQVLHLRCGQCGADWRFRRLRCMYCGNEDHRTLSCLYSEDQREKMRVEACDRCRGYLKVIASFSPVSPEMLPVEDLATMHLDYIAAGRRYDRSGMQKEALENNCAAET